MTIVSFSHVWEHSSLIWFPVLEEGALLCVVHPMALKRCGFYGIDEGLNAFHLSKSLTSRCALKPGRICWTVSGGFTSMPKLLAYQVSSLCCSAYLWMGVLQGPHCKTRGWPWWPTITLTEFGHNGLRNNKWRKRRQCDWTLTSGPSKSTRSPMYY